MANKTLSVVDELGVEIGMDDKTREMVARRLSGFLASTYTLYMKTLFYHWNVTGANFHGLHTMFEEQYQNLHMAGDEIAERVRALGHMTPGTYREFAELSKVKEDDSLPKGGNAMLRNLLKSHETCSKEARGVMTICEDAGDQVTMDMMIERMAFHDKAAWMLRATLE